MTFGTYKYEAVFSRFIVGSSTLSNISWTLSIRLNKVNVTCCIVFYRFDVVQRCQETFIFNGKHMNATKLSNRYRNIRNIVNLQFIQTRLMTHNSIVNVKFSVILLYTSYDASIIMFLFLVHPFHEMIRSKAGDE